MKITTLIRLPGGIHSGYGFTAVYDESKRRWLLTQILPDRSSMNWFLSLEDAKKYVGRWLDQNTPGWKTEQREQKLAKQRDVYHDSRGKYGIDRHERDRAKGKLI